VRLAIESRIDPLKLLCDMSTATNCVRLTIEFGIDPSKLLFDRSK
jgi:hypothetical protein